MATTGNYQVTPEAVLRVLGEITTVLQQIDGAVAQVRGMAPPGGSYGALGAAVASANVNLQTQSVATLASLVTALAGMSQRVRRSAEAYARADDETAGGYRGLSAPSHLPPWQSILRPPTSQPR